MGKLKVFTAFSGYDGQCLALQRLGIDFDLIGWSEIDRYAIQAHNAIFPEYAGRNYGDISKIDWATVPDFDLFTYSSPCQDFSQAGLQKGGTKGSGTRSSLLWECEKAIKEKRPKYLLMENVAALVTSKFIKLFNAWQRTLETYGYKNFAKVLNAKDFNVPQNRERIFLVSILDGGQFYFPNPEKLERRLKDVLETIEMFDRHKEKNIQKGNGFGWKPTDGSGVASTIETSANTRPADNFIIEKPTATSCPTIGTTDFGLPKLICCGNLDYNNDQINRIYNPEGLAPAQLCRNGGNTQTKIIEPIIVASRGRDHGSPQCLTLRRTEYGKSIRKEYEAGQIKEQRKNIQQLEPRTDGVNNTLTSVQKDNLLIEPKVITRPHGFFKGGEKDIMPCIKSSAFADNFVKEYRIRKLTPRECFRLMGVSEKDIDTIQAAGISPSQQYKLAGNSIVVDVLAAIFNKMFINTENESQQLTLF